VCEREGTREREGEGKRGRRGERGTVCDKADWFFRKRQGESKRRDSCIDRVGDSMILIDRVGASLMVLYSQIKLVFHA